MKEECLVEGVGSRSYAAPTTNGCAALLANFPNFTANISVGGESKLVRLKLGREIFSTEGANWTGMAKWVGLGLHWVNDLTYTDRIIQYVHIVCGLLLLYDIIFS